MAASGVVGQTLEFTPSWVVALVCFSIVLISLSVDRFLLCAGQLLQKSDKRKPLLSALRKIKEELMLLGFISLILSVFQTRIEKICIPEHVANVWLPCKRGGSSSTTNRFTNFFRSSETQGRHLLVEASASTDFCGKKGKVSLLTAEALHHLDIFIFVLATFHVFLCVFKIVLGYWKIHRWEILADPDVGSKHYHELQHDLQKKELKNEGCFALGNKWKPIGWMFSFFKQFYPSVTGFEYRMLHLNFMARHWKKRGEDFHSFITDAVKKDFEKIVGIRWYLWIFAVIFLLVNVAGWNAFFWMSFIPLTLLLVAGTILEHMITRLAEDVAQKHYVIANRPYCEKNDKDMFVEFQSHYFWFRNSGFVLNLIHVVLFENSLQLSFFFFILFQYDIHSCIMGKIGFVVPRIVIGLFVQLTCIYRTLPLYAIVKSQIPPEEKQSDKPYKSCPALERIGEHLKQNQSNDHIEECIADIEEVKIWLKENGMDEEEEMWIVTWISRIWNEKISKWIRYQKNKISKWIWIQRVSEWIRKRKARSNEVAAQPDSREGSAGGETTESDNRNSNGDIEAHNK